MANRLIIIEIIGNSDNDSNLAFHVSPGHLTLFPGDELSLMIRNYLPLVHDIQGNVIETKEYFVNDSAINFPYLFFDPDTDLTAEPGARIDESFIMPNDVTTTRLLLGPVLLGEQRFSRIEITRGSNLHIRIGTIKNTLPIEFSYILNLGVAQVDDQTPANFSESTNIDTVRIDPQIRINPTLP